ncbi:MAG TPA: gephyrin-like molybdotransferase Glp [Planctomycetota bacterium]|nr:gephyrin-like molybdotransferase Glp [Planctomycetota bacterium]
MLTVEQASEIILKDVPTLRVIEVALGAASGHVLAEECASDMDMPPFDKAMMDGYAVRSGDAGPLRMLEEVPAGKVPTFEVGPGTCSKIMTGAPVPLGADAVQQVEKTRRDADRVTLQEPVRAGQHIARRGTDIAAGQTVLRAGQLLRPAEIGALAAIGKSRVRVYARPHCAVLATGDELVAPGATPGPGQIRNSNTSQIAAQVRALGLECDDLGIVRDEEAALREAIRDGLKRDVLFLSGGVSAGDWDLVIPSLEAEGVRIAMHQVLIKPGRPFCFAPRVFGLPGNPVSSFVIFEVFARPYLGRLMGADLARPRIRARLETPVLKKIERVHYLPARVRMEDGGTVVRTLPWQGAADLFALTKANAFVVVPIQTAYEPGASVECMLL